MNDVRSRSYRRGIAIFVVLLVSLYPAFCLSVLLARRGGASIGEALRTALSFRELAHWGWLPVVALAGGLSVYFLVIRRGAGGGGTAPGAVQWRRLRLVSVIGALPLLVFVPAYLAYLLTIREGGEGWEWIAPLPLGLVVAGSLLFWLKKPTPEYLHALETGDRSRLEDERAQRVGGAAAATTLSVFWPILLVGGVLYEVLILGELPIRSAAELGIVLLVWGVASWHWTRAL